MIYLASASPRRQELLRQIGIAFEVLAPDIREIPKTDEDPAAYVMRVVEAKVRAGHALIGERGRPIQPILSADTEVVLDNVILGKPRSRGHGMEMLRQLSGRTHEVLTALALLHQDVLYQALSTSRVTFGPLNEPVISAYWDTGEPLDKAGGYAIQGRAGEFIAHIEGSYSGIVGLPLYELKLLLRRAGLSENLKVAPAFQ